jgi:hypothetical protein
LISRTIVTGFRSSGLRLEFVQDVVGATADLARDGQHGTLAADTRRSLRVQAAVGTIRALGVLGRFDQRPTEHGRAVPGQPPTTSRLAGLVDDRIQAGSADRLPPPAEACCFAESASRRQARIGPTP